MKWHACKLAKLSACRAKCMATINKIYTLHFTFNKILIFMFSPLWRRQVNRIFKVINWDWYFYEVLPFFRKLMLRENPMTDSISIIIERKISYPRKSKICIVHE